MLVCESTAIMTVGSVRGKERFVMPWRVGHGGRVLEEGEALSVGGQTRLVPKLTERAEWPQPAQKGFRMFQSMRERAWA